MLDQSSNTTIKDQESNSLKDSKIQPDAKREHFIKDNNFTKLLQIQESIYQDTQVKVSISKLVNLIIEDADLKAIQSQLIKRYQ